jgi:hypothetical protein
MGLLAKALPRGESASVQNTVQSPKGVYRAFFVGITDPVERVSEWNDKCRLCKGTGNGYGDEPQGCRVCHGTGKRTEQKVKILYSLENGVVEQEEVNFKLAGPGTGKDGTPLSPSTLFLRMREFSGLQHATEDGLDEWYSSLVKPIKIPVQVIIGDNQKGTATKITDVVRPSAMVRAPLATQAVDNQDVEPFDADDWNNIEHSR